MLKTLFAAAAIHVMAIGSASASTLVDWGSETFDSATGFAWLDLTVTQGLSANTAAATQTNYRLATLGEVMTLFSNADLPTTSTIVLPGIQTAAEAFIALFGTTFSGIGEYGAQGLALGTSGSLMTDPLVRATTVGGQVYRGLFDPGFVSQNTSFANVGVFMVRENATPVPLPAGGLLLITGIAGLAVARPKR